MANADDYANWIVANQSKKGSPEFNTVAAAYKEAKQTESVNVDPETGRAFDASIPTAMSLGNERNRINLSNQQQLARRTTSEKILGFSPYGAAETLTSAITGVPAALAQGVSAGAEALGYKRTNPTINAISDYLSTPYQPRSEAGQRYNEKVSDFSQNYLAPIAGLNELSMLGRGMPVNPKYTSAVIDTANQAIPMAGKAVTAPVVMPYRALKAGIYDPVVNKQDLLSSALMRAVGEKEAPNVIQQLQRSALTPDVKFSAGQASGNLGLTALEDTLKNAILPQGELATQARQNRAALAKPIRALAQDETALEAARANRIDVTDPMFEAVKGIAGMGGTELDSLLARAHSAGALQKAQEIAGIRGTKFSLPVIEHPVAEQLSLNEVSPPLEHGGMLSAPMPKVQESLGIMPYLKNNGGINMEHFNDLTGERSVSKSKVPVGVFSNKGNGLDDAVQMAIEGHYLPENVLAETDGGVQALRDLIQNEMHGEKAIPMGAESAQYQKYINKAEQAPDLALHPYETTAKHVAPLVRPETVVGKRILGEDLINLKKGIDQSISEATGAKKVELMNLKNDYQNWLSTQSPGFMAANNKFAELSKPISKMQVGQYIENKFIPATAEENPSSLKASALASALKNKNAMARLATGFKGSKLDKILTPAEMDSILHVSDDASRIAEMDKLGAGAGSPTARRMAATEFIGENFREKAPITSKIIDILNKTPIVKYGTHGVSAAGGVVAKHINTRMTAELDRMLASDPQAIAAALRKELDMINTVKQENPQGYSNLLHSQLPGDKIRKMAIILQQKNDQNQGEQ